jgi:hypothetical protein
VLLLIPRSLLLLLVLVLPLRRTRAEVVPPA